MSSTSIASALSSTRVPSWRVRELRALVAGRNKSSRRTSDVRNVWPVAAGCLRDVPLLGRVARCFAADATRRDAAAGVADTDGARVIGIDELAPPWVRDSSPPREPPELTGVTVWEAVVRWPDPGAGEG